MLNWRSEMVLPRWMKFSTESEEPKRAMPYTDIELPIRQKDRRLNAEPKCTKSRTLSEDPSRAFARTQGRRDLFVREPPLELQQDHLLSLGWQLGEREASRHKVSALQDEVRNFKTASQHKLQALEMQQLRERGELLDTQALQSPTRARVARVRDGKGSVTDGPFAETKEQIGGYFLIEARDDEHALASIVREGLGIMAGLWWDLAEQGRDIVKERERWHR